MSEDYISDGADFLEHHGVLGMRWGFRKNKDASANVSYSPSIDVEASHSPIKKIDPSIHTTTQDAAHQIAGLLKDRYGYEVTEMKAIPPKREFKNYLAYVEGNSNHGASPKGTIHIQPRDISEEMKTLEKKGWFPPGTGSARGVMTHETAHSMFHAEERLEGGVFRGRIVGGNREARDKAMDAAVAEAKSKGIPPRKFTKNISGYSYSSIFREETEAELFSAYHWSPNPPSFIKVWGETLHKEMGIDPTPFRKVVKNG